MDMNNPNNPRGQTPDDRLKKSGGKPMGDQMGQRARRNDGKDELSDDPDENKSNDMNKGKKSDKGQMDQGSRRH
jgi:hypothetical protein